MYLKKLAVIAATIFISSMCAGYVIYNVVGEQVTAQIEAGK